MVRNYKRKTSDPEYSKDALAKAVDDVRSRKLRMKVAANTYKVPYKTLYDRVKYRRKEGRGRNTALLTIEEKTIAQHLAVLADSGAAWGTKDLCKFIHYFLESKKRVVSQFVNNYPGDDWAEGFMKRHRDILSKRKCQNISLPRAAINEHIVTSYFTHLKESLKDVHPKNILNYDETCLVDDPGSSLLIFRRGEKRMERIMNTSKVSTSIMFAATAEGTMLDPYVVYKGDRLIGDWIEGGPINCHYNITKSGWFEGSSFCNWVETVVIPFYRRQSANEPKVIIGDNLPSHMSIEIVKLCEEHNIRMVFLPPNSTHLLQPLDVAVFKPMKTAWKKILIKFKKGEGRNYRSMPKYFFPKLLLQLLETIEEDFSKWAKNGFSSCGIHPFNAAKVIQKIKKDSPRKLMTREFVSPEFINYAEKEKVNVQRKRKRGRRLDFQPGKSVSARDFNKPRYSDTEEEDAEMSEAEGMEEVEEEMVQENEVEEHVALEDLEKDIFVLVLFEEKGGKQNYHYVGSLMEIEEKKVKIRFLRKVETFKCNMNEVSFKEPPTDDIMCIDASQIKKKLTLKRKQREIYYFYNNIKNIIVR